MHHLEARELSLFFTVYMAPPIIIDNLPCFICMR
jgi:hypothetical protein